MRTEKEAKAKLEELENNLKMNEFSETKAEIYILKWVLGLIN